MFRLNPFVRGGLCASAMSPLHCLSSLRISDTLGCQRQRLSKPEGRTGEHQQSLLRRPAANPFRTPKDAAGRTGRAAH